MLDPDARFIRKGNIVTRRIAGETLLVPVYGSTADMQKLYVLEGAGEFIWQQLDGHASLQTVTAAVVELFNVERAVAENDIEELIGKMTDAGLIEKAP